MSRDRHEHQQSEDEAHGGRIPVVTLGQAATHSRDHAVSAAAIESWCHRLLLFHLQVDRRLALCYATLTMRTVVRPSGVSTTTSSPATCPNKARPTGD